MIRARFLLLFLSSFLSFTQAYTISFRSTQVDGKTIQIKASFDLGQTEFLYKESIDFSIDSPELTLSQWYSNREFSQRYDEVSKETKMVFDGPVIITIFAHKTTTIPSDDIFLYVTYQTNSDEYPTQELFKLPLATLPATEMILLKQKEKRKGPDQTSTSSTSLQTHSWIDAIKKRVGTFSFYSLNNTAHWPLLFLIIAFFFAFGGIYSLYTSKNTFHLKRFYSFFGFTLICTATIMVTYMALALYYMKQPPGG